MGLDPCFEPIERGGYTVLLNGVHLGYAATELDAGSLAATVERAVVQRVLDGEPADNASEIRMLIAEAAQDLAEQAEDDDERYAADLADAEHARGFDAGIVHRGDAVRR